MRVVALLMMIYVPVLFAAKHPVTCGDGEMIAYHEGKTQQYVIEVRAPEIVEYFENESFSLGLAFTDSYVYSFQQLVEKKFPDNVFVDTHDYGQVLRVSNLEKIGKRGLVSKEYGPRLKVYEKGVELIISTTRKDPEFGQIYYEVGRWYFGDCDINL